MVNWFLVASLNQYLLVHIDYWLVKNQEFKNVRLELIKAKEIANSAAKERNVFHDKIVNYQESLEKMQAEKVNFIY